MNLQESIKRILEEETKPDKYIGMIEDLTEYFKNEDCVCDIKISYKKFRDLYLITVVLGVNEINNKFKGVNYGIWDYRQQLTRKITDEVLGFLPIPFHVNFSNIPKCYKDLNESEEKQSRLLSNIEEDGLHQVMQDTGLSLKQIKSKIGELPREVYERFIKDFINEEGYHQTDGRVQLGYEVEIQTHVYIDHFYMEGDKVTFEIKRFDNRGHQTEGYIESMLNLTDEEILRIVEDMIYWGPQTNYEI